MSDDLLAKFAKLEEQLRSAEKRWRTWVQVALELLGESVRPPVELPTCALPADHSNCEAKEKALLAELASQTRIVLLLTEDRDKWYARAMQVPALQDELRELERHARCAFCGWKALGPLDLMQHLTACTKRVKVSAYTDFAAKPEPAAAAPSGLEEDRDKWKRRALTCLFCGFQASDSAALRQHSEDCLAHPLRSKPAAAQPPATASPPEAAALDPKAAPGAGEGGHISFYQRGFREGVEAAAKIADEYNFAKNAADAIRLLKCEPTQPPEKA